MNKLITWFGDALVRAQRRRSLWNLLLFAFVAVLFGYISINLCKIILFLPHDGTVQFRQIENGHDLQMILVVCPLMLPSMAWAMIFANAVMWIISPARKVLDGEAKGHKGCSYIESQTALLKLAILLSAITIPIALIASYNIKL